jgi:hypothetical protein
MLEFLRRHSHPPRFLRNYQLFRVVLFIESFLSTLVQGRCQGGLEVAIDIRGIIIIFSHAGQLRTSDNTVISGIFQCISVGNKIQHAYGINIKGNTGSIYPELCAKQRDFLVSSPPAISAA